MKTRFWFAPGLELVWVHQIEATNNRPASQSASQAKSKLIERRDLGWVKRDRRWEVGAAIASWVAEQVELARK